MTLMLFEMKRSRVSLAIWTAAIALLLVICLVIFPDMKSQVNELKRGHFLPWAASPRPSAWTA